jgi:hypothetical protein
MFQTLEFFKVSTLNNWKLLIFAKFTQIMEFFSIFLNHSISLLSIIPKQFYNFRSFFNPEIPENSNFLHF